MRKLILFAAFFLIYCDFEDCPECFDSACPDSDVEPSETGIDADIELDSDTDTDEQIDSDVDEVATITDMVAFVGPHDVVKIKIEVDNYQSFCPFVELVFIDATNSEVYLGHGFSLELVPAWSEYGEFYYRAVQKLPKGTIGVKIVDDGQELIRARLTEQPVIDRGESCDPLGFENVCFEYGDVCSADYQGCEPREDVSERICGYNLIDLERIIRGPIRGFYSYFNSSEEWGGGSEMVLTFEVDNPGDYRISTVNEVTPMWEDTILYVRSECNNPSSEIGFNDDDGDDWRSTVELNNLDAGIYYVFVDTVVRTSGASMMVEVTEI